MSVRKQFLGFWKSHYNVLSISLYSIILIVLEEIMEIEFKCPQTASLRHGYVFCCFFCPAFIIFFLTLTSTSSPSTDCVCCIRKRLSWRGVRAAFRMLLPPVIWCVILLCDGRYIDCATSGSKGNKDQNANQSSAAELPSFFYTLSQIIGMAVLTVVSLLYGVYHMCHFWFCCNNAEEHWKEDVERLLEKEVRKHIEEKKKEVAEQIMKEKMKPSLQEDNSDFWENISCKGVANKIKEYVVPPTKNTGKTQQADKAKKPLMSETEMTAQKAPSSEEGAASPAEGARAGADEPTPGCSSRPS